MLRYFKKLSTGIKRLLIGGTLFIPPIFGIIFGIGDHNTDSIILGFIFLVPIYWIIILIGSWVYDGFKK